MNYLAHAFLAGNNQELLVGNFIADGLPGSKIDHLPKGIQRGVVMHRHIDTFTDNHVVNVEMRTLFHGTAGKYAGVVLDIFYDHLLANNWSTFSPEHFPDFIHQCYSTIENHQEWLPTKTAYMFPYMKQYNWLYNYSMEDGILRSLAGLSKRIKSQPALELAGEQAFKNKGFIEKHFLDFFPQLIESCSIYTK